jgi:tRNA(adenine34) deaminase
MTNLEHLETDEHWMSMALAQAELAEREGDVPVGCVIVHRDLGAVAKACNRREKDSDPTAHAEVLALREAARQLGRWRLNDCTLFVTLEPCFMCAGALVNARIGRVVYAAVDPKTGACQSLASVLNDPRLNHRCEVKAGVFEEKAKLQLQSFFRARRRGRVHE